MALSGSKTLNGVKAKLPRTYSLELFWVPFLPHQHPLKKQLPFSIVELMEISRSLQCTGYEATPSTLTLTPISSRNYFHC